MLSWSNSLRNGLLRKAENRSAFLVLLYFFTLFADLLIFKVDNASKMLVKRIFKKILRANSPVVHNYSDFSDFEKQLIKKYRPFTMTSPERIVALIRALEYICKNEIEGDIVECGVWKGGSAMIAAETLINLNSKNRNIYLYDTFEGMSEPTEKDVSFFGKKARQMMTEQDKNNSFSVWCYSPLDEVKRNLYSTNYPAEKLKFIAGKVEDTIPENIPQKIALLRLDTDWYESTIHELKHLFPLLSQYGVLIIDDYGHWQGCRKAVDEYISDNKIRIFLSRIDYTGRIGIKV